MERSEPVTVAAAADEARISRATAYRYFSNADVLSLEAVLDGRVATPQEIVGDVQDVRERVHQVQRYLFTLTRSSEAKFRIFLARALDSWVADGGRPDRQIRAGRRLPMYELALAPVRPLMTEQAFTHLVLALAACSGMESYLALKDVCRVDDTTADAIAASIIDAVLDRFLPENTKSGEAGRKAAKA